MRGSDYAELAAFVAVVNHGSFTRAASHLRISPSSLSQTIKKLEERLGVELLHRTTRSVSMTGSGVRLFDRFKPAMAEMEAAVVDLHEFSETPTGLVRLHLPRAAYVSLLEGRLGELRQAYPGIHLHLAVDDALVDIVRAGFDLNVRLSGSSDSSVTAVSSGGPIRHVAVASPEYLALHGTPLTPSDLALHRCIQWLRANTEHPSRWVFQINGCSTPVDVQGVLTVSHCDLAVAAAIESVGVAFVLENYAAAAIARKSLKTVLAAFLPPFPGWSVCYPRTSTLSTASHAVMQFLVKGPVPPRRRRTRIAQRPTSR